jgi:hypothetical protein
MNRLDLRTRFVRGGLAALPLIVAAAVFGALEKPAVVTDAVSGIVQAVPDVPATLVAASREVRPERTSYPGFDTYRYPGDAAMRAWREASPYTWVGYYLPAPCHKGTSWSGKRETLARMGWGLAVIYVGQQTWDRVPSAYETRYRTSVRTVHVTKRVKQTVRRNGKRVSRYVKRRVPVKKMVRTPYRVAVKPTARPVDECGTNLVSGGRGRMEALDAIARTEKEGFPRGTVVFLDIERMERMPQAMRSYYREWVSTLLEDGRYKPGVYAHTHNAERIYADVKAEYEKAGRTDEPPFWIASGRNFSKDKAPHEVGHRFASAWQGKLDIHETRNGIRLPIDVNVASVWSPSTATD